LSSFGAVAVLLYAAPAAPFSQPKNVLIGNVCSAIIGVGIGKAFGVSFDYRDNWAVSLSRFAAYSGVYCGTPSLNWVAFLSACWLERSALGLLHAGHGYDPSACWSGEVFLSFARTVQASKVSSPSMLNGCLFLLLFSGSRPGHHFARHSRSKLVRLVFVSSAMRVHLIYWTFV
jgi:hypothetical protein